MPTQIIHHWVFATVLFISVVVLSHSASAAEVAFGGIHGRIPITTWKQARDDRVILQKRDYSCAAASLATLLTHYYGLNVTEDDVIALAGKDAWLSMADVKHAADHYGFKTVGLAMGLDDLRKVKIPVIVYIRTNGGPHNAVLRGINEDRVWLADPANGNLSLTIPDFQAKWRTRDDPGFEGAVLAVIPNGRDIGVVTDGFFGTSPPRYSIVPDTLTPRAAHGVFLK